MHLQLKYLLCSFLAVLACNVHAQPNVVFIVCDDLNTHVSSSGYAPIKTPAFDRLAAAGTTFRRAYCQYPVCGPSRASFLHGLYPESTGVTGNKADIREKRPNTVSLPQAFKEQGYWTAATGKVFHNAAMDHGDVAWHAQTWFKNDEMPIEAKARQEFEAKHGSIEDRKNRKAWKDFLPTVAKQTRGQAPGWGPSGLTDEQHADGKNARQAIAWLDQKAYGDKPFFIAVGIHKPHIPYLAPDKYFDLYPRDELVFDAPPANLWDSIPRSAISKRYEAMGFKLGEENDPLRREFMQAYHACITFIDAQIGSVFDSLKKNGLWDDTIIVLTSDHGYHLGDHFMWGKVTLFESCNRVPLVVRVPGITKPGTINHGLVEMVDYFPTLMELCSLEAPLELQGKSFVPQLRDSQAKGKGLVYTVVSRGPQLGKAIRTPRWRYALWPDGEELYDLKNDVEELHNLAGSPERKEILNDLWKKLADAATRAARRAP